jgi:cell division transport system permease protein
MDPGTILCVLTVGFLAFVAAFALGAILNARRDVVLWDSRVFGRLTVQIMPEGLDPPPAEIPAAIAVLKSLPGVVSADVMTKTDNLALVRPWLGQNSALDSLPFPALIDVTLAPGAAPDITDVQKRLLASAPHAIIDDHRQWISELWPTTNPSSWMAALLLCVSVFAFVSVFISATRTQISTHWNNVELIRLFGATDWRVAQLCGTQPVIPVVLSSAAGTALCAGLFALRMLLEKAPAIIPPLSAADLPWLAFIPVTAAIMAWLTGHLLVISALRSA